MWWFTITIVSLGSLAGLYAVGLMLRTARNRSRRWNNLHERSRLISSQFHPLRDLQSQKKTPR